MLTLRQVYLFFGLLAAVLQLPAQQGTGQLSGILRDASDAVVPGVTITVVHQATGLRRSAVTDHLGNYSFAALPIGRYDVTATLAGFSTLRHTDINVAVGSVTRLDQKFQVAAVVEEITVVGGATLLNTESAEGGRVLDSTAVTSLPLNGRNFLQLVTLQPGVRSNEATGRQSFVINGAPPHQGVNLLVDGTDATGIESSEVGGIAISGERSTFTLGLDSIEEFKVHASNFSARYGRALGGVIEVVTKSGTNSLHGNAFWFFRNDVLNANTIQGNAAGLDRPRLRFNQFGANSGGPIVHDKLFFWVGYEGLRRRTGRTRTYTVLSDEGRAKVVDPQIRGFVDTFLPRATRATSNPDLGLLVRNEVPEIQEDIGMGRLDYHFGSGNSIFGRYNVHDTFATQPVLATDSVNSNPGRQHLFTLGSTHVLSPQSTMSLRAGLNRIVTATKTTGPPAGISVSGLFGVSAGFLDNFATSFTGAGDFTRIQGRHALSFGFEIRKVENNRSQGLPSGNFQFFSGAQQLQNFYQNIPNQLNEGFVILGNSGRSGNTSGYFEDTIKVSSKLTANLGLRYDYFYRPSERYGRMIGLVGDPFPISDLRFTKPGDHVTPADLRGFGPRVGIAYSPHRRAVIRLGYGLFVGQNYTAIATAAATTYVPPMIPKELFDPFYTKPLVQFTREDKPDLHYPDNSFVSPENILDNFPNPSPSFPRPDWKNTYTHQWSARVEGEITEATRLGVAYVGSKTEGIVGEDRFNLPRPFEGNTRENPAFGAITLRGSINHANYNALQVNLNRRIRSGLGFNVNYTWSHSIDDIFGFSGLNDPGVTPQTNSFKLQRASSSFDMRHDFTLDYYYDLPLANLGGPRGLVEGWTWGGITRMNAGTPFTVLTGTNVGDGVHTQRPNIVCTDASTGQEAGLFAQMLNSSCFERPTVRDPETGFFVGTLGRNTFTGPSFVTLDTYLIKNTRLTEWLTHQFRLELFNILNNTNFQNPVASINNPNFGKILGAGPGREIQFAMKFIW